MNNIFSKSEQILSGQKEWSGKIFQYEIYLGDKLLKVVKSDSLKSNISLNTIMQKMVLSGAVSESKKVDLNYKVYKYGNWQYTHRFHPE